MKRILRIGLLAVLIAALAATAVMALVSGPPVADTFVDQTASEQDQPHNGIDLKIQGSSGPGGGCEPVRTTYMRWDISELTQNVAWAELRLTTTVVTSQAANQQVTLFEVADDSWTEDVTYLTRPAVGDPIQTIVMPASVPAGTTIAFGGDSDQALADYINAEFGNNETLASFALQFATCAASSLQNFEDRESGANGPNLELRYNPNAVTVGSMEASGSSTTPLLFAGIALLLVAAGAGLIWARRSRVTS